MTALAHDDAVPVCAASSCTRPAAPGAVLCAPDITRLGDWIARLGTEYELLSAAPSMQGREFGSIGGGRLASQRSPGNDHVMAMRDGRRGTGRIGWEDADPWGVDDTPSVFATLHTYAEMVREGRELLAPVRYVPACATDCPHRSCHLGRGRPVRVPLTVATERKTLATHLDWILGQEWAGEFHDEIRGLWAVLRRANGHAAPTRRVHRIQAPCGTCGVRAITHRPGSPQAVCENCGATTELLEQVGA